MIALAFDARVPAALAMLEVAALAIAQAGGFERIETLTRGLLVGSFFHIACVLPRPAEIVRFAPSAISVPYAVCLATALLGVRARSSAPGAAEVVSVVMELLFAGAILALAVRLLRKGSVPGGGMGGTGRLVRMPPESQPAVSFERAARGIAHGMLKPVEAASDQLRSAYEKIDDPHLRDEMRDSLEILAQLQTLVRDLVDLARTQGRVVPRRLRLDAIAQQAVGEVHSRFPGAQIVTELDAGTVDGDELGLRCVIVNLIENALEEAAAGPVWVRIQASNVDVQLAVEDYNGGVDPEVREQIFEAFVTTRPRGTGLGLTLVREVCRAHGGEATFESLKNGSRFVVRLPRSQE